MPDLLHNLRLERFAVAVGYKFILHSLEVDTPPLGAKLAPQFLRYDLFLNYVKLVDITAILRLACSGYIGKVAYDPIDPAIKQHETCVAMSFFPGFSKCSHSR